MGKVESIEQAKQKLAAGQDAVVSEVMSDVFEAGKADVVPNENGQFTQEQMDAAVAQAKLDGGAESAEALSQAQSHVGELETQLNDLRAEDVVEDAQMAELEAKVAAIKALLG